MSGNAAHKARGGIVHHSPQDRSVLLHFGRRDARLQSGAADSGFLHTQRVEENLLNVFVFGQSAQPVHDFAQQDEIDIAVNEFCFRRIGRLVGQGLIEYRFRSRSRRFEIEIGTSPEKCVIRSRT